MGKLGSDEFGGPVENTDIEIWRRIPGDFYSPSIHVTASGGIGMDVGGRVIVAPVEAWFKAMEPQSGSPFKPTDESLYEILERGLANYIQNIEALRDLLKTPI